MITKLTLAIVNMALLISTAPAQSARHQFVDDAGKPAAKGTVVLYRLGSKRSIKLDRNGVANVELDPRESLIALRGRKGRVIASYSIIWIPGTANYRINALGCQGWACAIDGQVNLFPVNRSALKP